MKAIVPNYNVMYAASMTSALFQRLWKKLFSLLHGNFLRGCVNETRGMLSFATQGVIISRTSRITHCNGTRLCKCASAKLGITFVSLIGSCFLTTIRNKLRWSCCGCLAEERKSLTRERISGWGSRRFKLAALAQTNGGLFTACWTVSYLQQAFLSLWQISFYRRLCQSRLTSDVAIPSAFSALTLSSLLWTLAFPFTLTISSSATLNTPLCFVMFFCPACCLLALAPLRNCNISIEQVEKLYSWFRVGN